VEIGILALQGDFSEHVQALSEVGATPRLVKRAEDLDGVAGLVLPGGESTTLGMLLESSGLAQPVSEVIASGVPVFGTCAGMILLSEAVTDGRPDQKTFRAVDIDVRRNGYGRQLHSFECDLEVAGFDGALPAVFIRAPVIERVGAGVEVLSRLVQSDPDGAGSSESAVLVRQERVLAAAFHPELTPDRRLHAMFIEMVEKEGR
jgi:pyridoxal 5'-phosphate synthase pdxT subunit